MWLPREMRSKLCSDISTFELTLECNTKKTLRIVDHWEYHFVLSFLWRFSLVRKMQGCGFNAFPSNVSFAGIRRHGHFHLRFSIFQSRCRTLTAGGLDQIEAQNSANSAKIWKIVRLRTISPNLANVIAMGHVIAL
jgi:hypothetical protein